MPPIIHCQKYHEPLESLDFAPYPGELGQQILKAISKKAWLAWLAHQTLLINENRLNLLDKETRKYLESEMKKFLFTDESEKPAGFIPPEEVK